MTNGTIERRHRASLLLEAVVVLAIIGLMLAIILPALVRACNSARRVNCLNNLRNVGLALYHYQDPYGVFPPGYISRGLTPDSPASAETGPGWGWGSMLLPFLDQGQLLSSMSFEANAGPASWNVSSFLCPEAESLFSRKDRISRLTDMPVSNYVGVYGVGNLADDPGRPSGPGIFYRNSRVGLDDIPDGVSTTLMVGERGPFPSGSGKVQAPTLSTWYAAIPGTRTYSDDGTRGSEGGAAMLLLGTAGLDRPQRRTARPNGAQGIPGFSSPHQGGANFLRADGSVGLISENIDFDVYRHMAVRNDSRLRSSF